MTIADLLSIAVAGVLAGCAAQGSVGRAAAEPEVAFHERPSQIEFEMEFDRRHFAVQRSAVCAEPAPLHAVLIDVSPLRNEFLGFCDGSMVSRLRDGGLMSNLLSLRAERTMQSRGFHVGGAWIRTHVPIAAEVEIRAEGEGARLIGKGFDVLVRPSTGAELPVDPGCNELERGPGYVICRHGRSHRMRARVEVAGRWFSAESEPRMRATLRQSQQMLRSVQLMHL